ncbi:hypothetical protein RRG08_033876 [Elysia crispata]|uniref:Uncharacterized protein n=1 Tax=Elysia crispata TaxID=231223 RepID=A0AAE1ECJ1_9GAST|nr:hypothetical protein RRG08_033876 [Elysia crispata]
MTVRHLVLKYLDLKRVYGGDETASPIQIPHANTPRIGHQKPLRGQAIHLCSPSDDTVALSVFISLPPSFFLVIDLMVLVFISMHVSSSVLISFSKARVRYQIPLECEYRHGLTGDAPCANPLIGANLGLASRGSTTSQTSEAEARESKYSTYSSTYFYSGVGPLRFGHPTPPSPWPEASTCKEQSASLDLTPGAKGIGRLLED